MKTLQSSGAKPEISLYANFLAWKFHTCRFPHCRKYRSCGIQQCAWRAPPVTWCCCCVAAVCVRGGGSASLLQPPPGGGRELLTGHTSENREAWPPGGREEVQDIPLSADLRPWIRPFLPYFLLDLESGPSQREGNLEREMLLQNQSQFFLPSLPLQHGFQWEGKEGCKFETFLLMFKMVSEVFRI